MYCEKEKCSQLGSKRLGGSYSNFRTSMGIDIAGCLTRNHGAHNVTDGQCFTPYLSGFPLGGNGVRGLTGLRNQESEFAPGDDGRPISEFAGVVNFHWYSGQALNHELPGQRGVPACAASCDINFLQILKLFGADIHGLKKDIPRTGIDTAPSGIADGARLLMDFLEHEMAEAALFRHHWVPGDMLHCASKRPVFKIGDKDLIGCNNGNISILQEEEVTCMFQNRRQIG